MLSIHPSYSTCFPNCIYILLPVGVEWKIYINNEKIVHPLKIGKQFFVLRLTFLPASSGWKICPRTYLRFIVENIRGIWDNTNTKVVKNLKIRQIILFFPFTWNLVVTSSHLFKTFPVVGLWTPVCGRSMKKLPLLGTKGFREFLSSSVVRYWKPFADDEI